MGMPYDRTSLWTLVNSDRSSWTIDWTGMPLHTRDLGTIKIVSQHNVNMRLCDKAGTFACPPRIGNPE